MDPISIATAASSLVVCVVKSGKALAGVYEKYQDAQRCIFLMQTECTVLAAALSSLQLFFSRASAVTEYPDFVLEAIDLSLVGCTLTLSILGKEIEKLTEDAMQGDAMSKSKRLRYLWKEESMNELLRQLNGQSSALSLLLKALDSSYIDQILTIVRSGQHTFQQVRRGAASIRQSHPEERYAESILDMKFDDTKTIYSLDDDDHPEGSVNLLTEQLHLTTLDPESRNLQSSADDIPSGWQKHYHAERDQWYVIVPQSGQIRWLGQATGKSTAGAVDSITHSASATPLEKAAAPDTPILTVPPAIQPISPRPPPPPPPRSRPRVGAPAPVMPETSSLDFAPWKMNTDEKFRKVVDNFRSERGIPALAVGIVSTDGPQKVYVTGYRKLDSPDKVTRADCLSVGNSNVVTTAALAVLVEKGVLAWDETLPQLFPAIAHHIHPFHHTTTLQMLSAHVTGLTAQIGVVEDGELFDYLRHGGQTTREGRWAVAVSYLARPPDATPGGQYAWNWANALLVAAAMEQRTDTSLELLVKRLVFTPLEMYSAGFGRHPQVLGHDTGHEGGPIAPLDGQCPFQPTAMYASTGVYCSGPDFAVLVGAFLRGAMGMSTPLMKADTARHYFAPLPDHTVTPGSWVSHTREWAGGTALMTSGRCDGFGLSTWLAPLTGKAYFAITNVGGDVGLKATDEAVSLCIRHALR